MSPKNSSLAYDETLKEFDNDDHHDINFEPELTVLVKANYLKTPHTSISHEIVHVKGRVTVSF